MSNTHFEIVIEFDRDHLEHMWSDVERGYQEEARVRAEADDIERGNLTPYGVRVARVCDCCESVTDEYVTALWGCVVESFGQEGRYLTPDEITDNYLRDVARELLIEATSLEK